jgi:hypothetical protein
LCLFRIQHVLQHGAIGAADNAVHTCGPPESVEQQMAAGPQRGEEHLLNCIKVGGDVESLQRSGRELPDAVSLWIMMNVVHQSAERARISAGKADKHGGVSPGCERVRDRTRDRGLAHAVGPLEDDQLPDPTRSRHEPLPRNLVHLSATVTALRR